ENVGLSKIPLVSSDGPKCLAIARSESRLREWRILDPTIGGSTRHDLEGEIAWRDRDDGCRESGKYVVRKRELENKRNDGRNVCDGKNLGRVCVAVEARDAHLDLLVRLQCRVSRREEIRNGEGDVVIDDGELLHSGKIARVRDELRPNSPAAVRWRVGTDA